jgi:hypothetical protein
MQSLYLSICLLSGTILGYFRQKDGPPPAVVRICGEDGNGLTVLKINIDSTMNTLYKQGCFYEDQHVIPLDENYSFVYGTKVLIGESKR